MNTLISKNILKNKLITLFVGKKIITLNCNNDEVEAVATQENKIVGYGQLKKLQNYFKKQDLDFVVNKSFINNYFYPGFIETHMHPQLLGLYLLNFPYIGFFDRKISEKKKLNGFTNFDEMISYMKKVVNNSINKDQKWINFWGFDPLLHNNNTLTKEILDEISDTKPICVLHQSGHVISLNTLGLQISGYLNLNEGHPLYKNKNIQIINKKVTGIISETSGMELAIKAGAMSFSSTLDKFIEATELVTQIAQSNGLTTISDKGLGFPSLNPKLSYEAYWNCYLKQSLFTRIHLDIWYKSIDIYGGWYGIENMMKNNNDYLWVAGQKIILDGSIQGFTANLIPGQKYVYENASNGNLQLTFEELEEYIVNAEKHNLPSHIHANGSGAIEKVIQVIEKIHPYNSNTFRHSIEHNQLVTNHQLYRMGKNNILSNFFINHIYYYGDVHAKYTIGPILIHEMNPANLALYNNVIFSFHSDDPVTPMNPLLSIWTATNRKSFSNTLYGKEEIISVYEALKAITINAAYLLGQENHIGSIDLDKYADFTILKKPLIEENKEDIKNIKIVATVLGGNIQIVH